MLVWQPAWWQALRRPRSPTLAATVASTARASALTPPRTAMPRTAALCLVGHRARVLLESKQAPEPYKRTIEKEVEGEGGVDQVTFFTIILFIFFSLPSSLSLSLALYFSFSLIFVADLLVTVLHSPPQPSPRPPCSLASPSLAIVNVLLLALRLVIVLFSSYHRRPPSRHHSLSSCLFSSPRCRRPRACRPACSLGPPLHLPPPCRVGVILVRINGSLLWMGCSGRRGSASRPGLIAAAVGRLGVRSDLPSNQ